MKLLMFWLFVITANLCNAQNVTQRAGTVYFPSIADYEYFADNPANRQAISNVVLQNGLATLKTTPQFAPLEDVPDFLQQVLNTDYIVSISSFYVKIDFVNQRGLVISASLPGAYNNIAANNLKTKGMMVFTMDDVNALDIMAQMEGSSAINDVNYRDFVITEPSDKFTGGPNVGTALSEPCFSCGNPPGQDLKRWPTWGTPRADGSCTAPGNNTALLAGDLKLVYQKAVIYFSLQSKEKCRQYCQYGGNPQTAGTVSVYMYLSGTVKYVRCGWGERANSHTSNFTLDNEKSWRPFESSRRLEKYDFTVQFKQAENLNNPHTFDIMNIKYGY